MPQTPEAQAFLSHITALPKGIPVSLDEALQPSLDDEAELRRLFATDTKNSCLSDPYVGLVDVFDAPHGYQDYQNTSRSERIRSF